VSNIARSSASPDCRKADIPDPEPIGSDALATGSSSGSNDDPKVEQGSTIVDYGALPMIALSASRVEQDPPIAPGASFEASCAQAAKKARIPAPLTLFLQFVPEA
jgi:hypothetical protein